MAQQTAACGDSVAAADDGYSFFCDVFVKMAMQKNGKNGTLHDYAACAKHAEPHVPLLWQGLTADEREKYRQKARTANPSRSGNRSDVSRNQNSESSLTTTGSEGTRHLPLTNTITPAETKRALRSGRASAHFKRPVEKPAENSSSPAPIRSYAAVKSVRSPRRTAKPPAVVGRVTESATSMVTRKRAANDNSPTRRIVKFKVNSAVVRPQRMDSTVERNVLGNDKLSAPPKNLKRARARALAKPAELPVPLEVSKVKENALNQETVPEAMAKVIKRENFLSWEEYFMAVSFLSAQRSKDPSSQVGACIVNDEKKIVGIGYNGMPNGCNDDELPWEREGPFLDTKYAYVCHAEMNAIMNKNSASVKDCTMYVALFPCNECAKLCIQSGIREIVYIADKYHDNEKFVAARRLLDMAKVKYRQFIPRTRKVTIDFGALDSSLFQVLD